MTEEMLELETLKWFQELGYATLHGNTIAHDGPSPERASYADVLLVERLRQALVSLNPHLPPEAIDDAIREIKKAESASLEFNNRRFHALFINGIPVSFKTSDGRSKGDRVRVLDFDNPDGNDWLVVQQLTIQENSRSQNRRPDVVVFVNGIPICVIELKNPTDEGATIWSAFQQLQTYKSVIPSLFVFNELLVVSDGNEARLGSLTADQDRFSPWRTIEGERDAERNRIQLEVLIKGVFDRRWLLDYIRHFIVFEDDGKKTIKKLAAYHQFHAVRKAVKAAVKASGATGDKRGGVVWHTQGSGKSLSMAFLTGSLIDAPEMSNPTIVVLTDRNDLDDQLFGTFSRCQALFRQEPVQAEDRDDLQAKLRVASGGVVFTTIQKFLPAEKGGKLEALSSRRNIIVIADEAHRSQYDFIDGFARHMRDALPEASFIGFTGTPIEKSDANTTAVFGDYIDIYDIQRAIEDKATVPIYYEGRLAKIVLDNSKMPHIDEDFEELTEGEEEAKKEKLKTKWAALEALVGAEKRLGLIAQDIVNHFEQRQQVLAGKAMIVVMSRRICMDLYDAIVKLRPDWHSDDDDKGSLKVVMTGNASEGVRVAGHARNKQRREELAKRFKDPKDPLQLVIVRDMWLTGFDSPSVHTMYVDKPMRGHGLLQAIARVNRVFKDKPGGLIVDYIGIADQLKAALATYTESGGKGRATLEQSEAVEVLLEKFEIVEAMLHGFDVDRYFVADFAQKLVVLNDAADFVVGPEVGKDRFLKAVSDLSKAFALAVPAEEALSIRDRVGFYQAVRARVVKATTSERSPQDLDAAVRQIVSQAVAGDGIVDIFSEAGLKSPDISILSDEFLAEVRGMPQKNLALEMLKKLINDEVKARSKRNVVQARSFKEMLEASIKKYQNRAIETAEVIQELIDLAKELRQADKRGESLGLNDDEVAFYDALSANESARLELGDDSLRKIAREVAQNIKQNVSIDWTIKESVRAKLRASVKRVLRKYRYPPDGTESATDLVLEQAEALSHTLTE
ncbi:MAG: type I restriction endonuclease subunit R [Phycisphaerae bacterium]